ncbi:MAG: 7-cyano-7-deazaguanine synthase [Nitrospinota bacterium]
MPGQPDPAGEPPSHRSGQALAGARLQDDPPTVPSQAVCVLVSGGLDSCVLAAELARRRPAVFPLFIRQGLRWEETELYWLGRFLESVKVESLRELAVLDSPVADLYGGHWSVTGETVPGAETEDAAVYLPGRNVLLLTKAAVFCAMRRIPEIALGILERNPFPDATPEFFRRMESALTSALDFPIRITRPLSGLTKKAITQMGRGLPLELTFSCLNPAGRNHCGVCNKCAERRKGFLGAGLEDRTVYAASP